MTTHTRPDLPDDVAPPPGVPFASAAVLISIDKLSPEHYAVLTRRTGYARDPMTNVEVAAELGLPLATVAQRAREAGQELRRLVLAHRDPTAAHSQASAAR